MQRPRPLFLILAPLLLAACSGGADPKSLYDQGQGALASGDYASAAERFDQASAALAAAGETGSELYVDATLGAIEARIRTTPEQAKSDFLELAKARPSALEPRDFSYVGNKFAAASRFMEAIEVLDAGMKAHAESPQLKELQTSIRTAAEKAGDSAALEAMAGLGYL